jgi:hypothetical protein
METSASFEARSAPLPYPTKTSGSVDSEQFEASLMRPRLRAGLLDCCRGYSGFVDPGPPSEKGLWNDWHPILRLWQDHPKSTAIKSSVLSECFYLITKEHLSLQSAIFDFRQIVSGICRVPPRL